VPFTLAHAAAALPFKRTRLVMSALVVGCLSPDFEYFIRLAPGGRLGHTLPGLFILDLPLGFIVLWLFHAFAKKPLLTCLPSGFQSRLRQHADPFPFRRTQRIILIMASILIGAMTHIVWDSFTHPTFWPYRHWTFLSHPVHLPFARTFQIYKLLQHASSLFGCIVLLIWTILWYNNTRPDDGMVPPQRSTMALVVVAITLSGAVLRAIIGVGISNGTRAWGRFAIEALITSITFFWLQLVILGVAGYPRSRPPDLG
jgi:hypothetical protein